MIFSGFFKWIFLHEEGDKSIKREQKPSLYGAKNMIKRLQKQN